MDLYQIISYPLYVAGIFEVILGFALLKKAAGTKRALRACAALFLFLACFVFCTAISYTLASLGRDYNFFNRASWIGWFMIPACLQFVYYLQDENSRAARVVGWALYPFWSVVLALTLFTDLVEPGDLSLIPFVALNGPLENPLRIVGSVMALWLLVEVYRAKNRMAGITKAQLNLFFYGTLFFNLACILVAGILPIFNAVNPAFTTFFSFPWVLIAYYAITRYRLFDLRLVISRVLNIALLLSLLCIIQIGVFKLLRPALGESFSLLVSLVMIGILFFGTRINRNIRQWIERLILKDRYDYQRVLRESTKAIITILDLAELLDYIIASMKKSLGVENVCLALEERGGLFSLQRENGVRSESESSCPLNDAVASWLQKTGQVIVREELERTRSDDNRILVREYMKNRGAELILPLSYKGDIKGFIVLGQKGNKDPYFQSDIDLLESLAGHAVVAIENARLFDETRQAKKFLEESEARFRVLAETTTAGIFIHRGGRFIYANSAIKKITGYEKETFLALDFWELVHPDNREMVRDRGKARLQGAQPPAEYEVKIIIKNGEERWGNLSAGIINYEGGPAIIVTFFDITDRKRTEEEKVRLYEARIAEEKRHVMEKEKLLMDLHDGIGGITTNISILSEVGQKTSDIESIKKTLSTISRLSREGISEIRSFMHSLDAQDLNWRTVATELKSQGTNMVEPHQITFMLTASIDEIQEQPGSLLWVNLFKIYKEALTNVIKHSKAGSVVITLQVTQDRILLVVQDDGIGCDAQRSSGRGLLNMRKRAEVLGGRLTLSPGKGTRVNLEFPLPLKYPMPGMA